MARVRVSSVQMTVAPTKNDNLPRILDFIQNSNCDFIVFPEMSLTGYNNDFSDTRTREAWRQIAAACRTSYVSAIIGTGVRHDGHTHIQSRVYSDAGNLLGAQEKLVPTEDDRAWCRPGEELHTFQHHDITFGCLIGNDLWVAPGHGPYPDPRLTFRLSQNGAQVIFHSACTGTDPDYTAYYEANLKLRAREGGCYIVLANTASEDGALNIPSGVISPMGEWIAHAPTTGEHIVSHDLEVE